MPIVWSARAVRFFVHKHRVIYFSEVGSILPESTNDVLQHSFLRYPSGDLLLLYGEMHVRYMQDNYRSCTSQISTLFDNTIRWRDEEEKDEEEEEEARRGTRRTRRRITGGGRRKLDENLLLYLFIYTVIGSQRLINLDIPVFVRSLKSSNVELGYYLNGFCYKPLKLARFD